LAESPKYDRYLADVSVRAVSDKLKAVSPGQESTENEPKAYSLEPTAALFLNNALLSAGHAIRYDDGAKEE